MLRKSVQTIQVSLISDKKSGVFTWRPILIYDYLAEFFLELEMFQIKFVYVQCFSPEIMPFMT
jgi:hypothetical protein